MDSEMLDNIRSVREQFPDIDLGKLRDWMFDLKGGSYQQARGKLKVDNEGEQGMCCLGVISDRSRQGRWEAVEDANGVYTYIADMHRSHTHLVPRVCSWLGLPEGSQDVKLVNAEGQITCGATMNDDEAASFGEIADAVYRTYLMPLP